jgi:double-stranded uracil-DNA glycosylase
MVLHPFPPVFNEQSTTLILGSFPSVQSRETGFYYGHPRNRFWAMLSAVYDEPLPMTIADKKQLLLAHHLALWDAIASCEISGSADASVRHAVPVDLSVILLQANIQHILCNGKLAGTLYTRYLKETAGLEAIVLPSTSPANAAWSLTRLTDTWQPYLIASNEGITAHKHSASPI